MSDPIRIMRAIEVVLVDDRWSKVQARAEKLRQLLLDELLGMYRKHGVPSPDERYHASPDYQAAWLHIKARRIDGVQPAGSRNVAEGFRRAVKAVDGMEVSDV